jgi:hypothetical protein
MSDCNSFSFQETLYFTTGKQIEVETVTELADTGKLASSHL